MLEGGSDDDEEKHTQDDTPTPEGKDVSNRTDEKNKEDARKVPGSPAPAPHGEDIFGNRAPETGGEKLTQDPNMDMGGSDSDNEEDDEDYTPEEDGEESDDDDSSDSNEEMVLDDNSSGASGDLDTSSASQEVPQAQDPPGLHNNEQL